MDAKWSTELHNSIRFVCVIIAYNLHITQCHVKTLCANSCCLVAIFTASRGFDASNKSSTQKIFRCGWSFVVIWSSCNQFDCYNEKKNKHEMTNFLHFLATLFERITANTNFTNALLQNFASFQQKREHLGFDITIWSAVLVDTKKIESIELLHRIICVELVDSSNRLRWSFSSIH